MNLTPIHTLAIKQIVREEYPAKQDFGAIESYIQPSIHTSDFELPDGHLLRCYEDKKGVFYHVFRMK